MNTEVGLTNVSLEDICREQGQPYYQLAAPKNIRRQVKSLKGVTEEPYITAPMYCGRVNNVVVFGKSYVCDTPGRAVFYHQSHRNYAPEDFVQYYTSEIANGGPHPSVKDECCFLGGFSGDTKFFGHFIFEYLYRLAAFDKCGLLAALPLAVYDTIPDGWLSFIELYGVPKERFIKVPQLPAPGFVKAWIASCPNSLSPNLGYTYWDEGILNVRQRLIENAGATVPTGPKRIYLGRRTAKHRKLVNEDAVWQYLSGLGFEYPEFENLSAAEQIRLVSGAEIVVIVPGSGSCITNFAPADCIILEFLPPHLVGGLGPRGFSTVIGQTYERVASRIAEGTGAAGLTNDLEVELPAVIAAVERAIELKTR